MLTNKSFDEALNVCFEKEPKDFSMDFGAMEAALKRAGLKVSRMEEKSNIFNSNTLIECKHKTKGYWHYIVYDAEQQAFLDPIPNPPPINEYEFYRAILLK